MHSTVQLGDKRTTHTRIIRAYFAYTRSQYVHVCATIRAYMSPCYSFLEVSLYEALLGKQDISGMKKRQVSTRNLHDIVKNVNKSLNISSFRSLGMFTNKVSFISTWLISCCQEVKKKIEAVAKTPYFSNMLPFIEYFRKCMRCRL